MGTALFRERADHREHYGEGEQQFGDLWLPDSASRAPLVVFVHGGWWKAEYDLTYADPFCAALKKEGMAVWSVEYRRVGDPGGGWPGTFQDVGSSVDFIATLARKYRVDESRVITMGHSAGGHLAFWAAGRHHVEPQSSIYQPPRTTLCGAISLAGAVDLRMTIDLSEGRFAHDKDEVAALMGGTPQQWPEHYRDGDPGSLLPFNVAQILLQGTQDDQIPPQLPERWAEKARKAGDAVTVITLPGVDHMEMTDPHSNAWIPVRDAAKKLLLNR